ncbi:MAG: filamentous hemagglutinin N-terminal domain-containing protein, partial [Spirochaetota bacterium]
MPANAWQSKDIKTSVKPDSAAKKITIVQDNSFALLKYDEFSLKPGEKVEFLQPDSQSSVLILVEGTSPTVIAGRIYANGRIIIVNPNGIIFEKSSEIAASGFSASTYLFTDEEFLTGNFKNLIGIRQVLNLKDGIEVHGKIQAESGDVFLLGEAVTQSGIIEARHQNDGGFIRIISSDTTLISGILDASSGESGIGGRIQVLGAKVGLTGAEVNASGDRDGGEVLVGGDYKGQNAEIPNALRTFVGASSTITADARSNGNGGKVVVWADEVARFYGTISAQGGEAAGDGGFVEVSGKEYLAFRGTVNTLAPHGKTGTLLLDPANIAISNG